MVQRIERQSGLQAFIDAIEKDGCVIIKDFTDLESLQAADAEVQPYLDASLANSGSTVGALNGGTATCTRLVGRSKTVREKFFSDSLYQVRFKSSCIAQTLRNTIQTGTCRLLHRPRNESMVRFRSDSPEIRPSPFHLHHHVLAARIPAPKAPSRRQEPPCQAPESRKVYQGPRHAHRPVRPFVRYL